jgi:hypothetical protein
MSSGKPRLSLEKLFRLGPKVQVSSAVFTSHGLEKSPSPISREKLMFDFAEALIVF